MKKKTHLYFIIALLLSIMGGTGCSLNNVNETAVGEENLLAARRILAESLSSDQSGLILSLNDALTSVSENEFINTDYEGERSGRGNETDYKHIYREENGMHIITFKRNVEDALFSKTVGSSLRYRYRTSNGTNIKFPEQNANSIAFIYYDGRREGDITTLHKESHFVRQDTFLISGVNTSALKISGVYHSAGSIEITPIKGSAFKRNYELEINLLDITASSAAFNNNRDFWKKVSGTLSWQLQISHGDVSTKTGGTVKLAGAGMALLNFRGSTEKYTVNLNNGDLKDRDKEFEGRITVVDLSEQSITLFNGRLLYLTPDTEIEEDDYTSLEAVKEAANNGINVRTEGEGGIQNGRFIVTEIEFEKEDGDQEDDPETRIEFEDVVSSADATAGIFTLFGKATLAVDEATVIDDSGDYQNLQEVAEALADGLQVTAEGEAITNSVVGKADFTAKEVKFEHDEPDSNSGEED